MADQAIDTSDMYAVHDCLRHEFARLPITVKAVDYGNSERAGVVGRHVLLMLDLLHAHHASEDETVWPILHERAPESAALVEEMEVQHTLIHATAELARTQAQAWIDSPGSQERAALHITLIALEREILKHLATEEQEVLPLVVRDFTVEEYERVGEHSRGLVAPEQMPIVLGLILDNTSRERGEAITASMPPEAVAAFEQFGRPAYAEYKANITNY